MNCKTLHFVLLAAAGLIVAADAADPIGSVVAVQGQASATGADGAARDLAAKAAVFTGDALKTGPGSRIQVLFSDDSLFSQGENSETVLDEYVYDPKAKEKNSFKARVGKGVFRAVTGKITELNPDRFQIQTGRSTIGIRGCGVGGQLGPDQDNFVVDFVSPGTQIVIGFLQGGGGQRLVFHNPGIGFVGGNGGMGQGPFDPAFFRRVLNGTVPGLGAPGAGGAAGGGSGGNGGSGGSGGGLGGAGGGGGDGGGFGGNGGGFGGVGGGQGGMGGSGGGPLNPLFGDAGQIFLNRRLTSGALGSSGGTGGTGGAGGAGGSGSSLPDVPPDAGEDVTWEYFGYASGMKTYSYAYSPPPYEASERSKSTRHAAYYYQDVIGSAEGAFEGPPQSDLSSKSEENTYVSLDTTGSGNPAFLQVNLYDVYNPSSPAETLKPPDASTHLGGNDFDGTWDSDGTVGRVENRGDGADWVWGEWGQTQTTAYAETTLSGVYAAGRTLGVAEFEALRQGSQVYSLNSDPIGRATAFVGGSGALRRLDGTADLGVLIGNGAAHWSGAFNLSNGQGDSLTINVNESPFSALGHLWAIPSDYALQFNGSSYGPPQSGSMTGNLVGPGPNTRGQAPITGAIGSGRFDHGYSGPKVDLTYATDLKSGTPNRD